MCPCETGGTGTAPTSSFNPQKLPASSQPLFARLSWAGVTKGCAHRNPTFGTLTYCTVTLVSPNNSGIPGETCDSSGDRATLSLRCTAGGVGTERGLRSFGVLRGHPLLPRD